MAGIAGARFLSSAQVIIEKDRLSLSARDVGSRAEARETVGSFLRTALFADIDIDLCSPGDSSGRLATRARHAYLRENLLSTARSRFCETTAANCAGRSGRPSR